MSTSLTPNLQKVQYNRYNRIKIACCMCNEMHNEDKVYADLNSKFTYVCFGCSATYVMLGGANAVAKEATTVA